MRRLNLCIVQGRWQRPGTNIRHVSIRRFQLLVCRLCILPQHRKDSVRCCTFERHHTRAFARRVAGWRGAARRCAGALLLGGSCAMFPGEPGSTTIPSLTGRACSNGLAHSEGSLLSTSRCARSRLPLLFTLSRRNFLLFTAFYCRTAPACRWACSWKIAANEGGRLEGSRLCKKRGAVETWQQNLLFCVCPLIICCHPSRLVGVAVAMPASSLFFV